MITSINLLRDIALKRFEEGELAKAENLFIQILEQVPDDGNAMRGLADVAIERGDFRQAEALLGKVTAIMPENSAVLISLGRAYLGMKRTADSITCLDRAKILEPNNANVYCVLSEVFVSTRELDKAIQAGTRATTLNPNDAKAFETLGNAFLEARQPAEALGCYEHSLNINPDNWQVYANCGMAHVISGHLEEAKKLLTFSNALNPMDPAVTLPLASVLIDLGFYTEAGLILDKLVVMMPQNARALYLAGINAFHQGNLNKAIGNYIKALALDENNMEIRVRLGEALIKEGKTENALTIYNQAIEKSPDHLLSYAQIARLALFQNHLKKAFEAIESVQSLVASHVDVPLWTGDSLNERKLLLYSQFGVDELNLFARFINKIGESGSTVLLKGTPPVQSLMGELPGVDQCLLPDDEAPKFDCHAPLEQLPRLLNLSNTEIAETSGFIPNSERLARWKNSFQSDKFRVGIMWRKEIDEHPDIFRSIPLNSMKALAEIDEIQLYSLQTACGKEELDDCDFSESIRHVTALENTNLAERLAGAVALDLFISTDTYTAQVAAQAGFPVWVLLTTGPEWYYGASGDQTIWMPSARLFRQSHLNEWDEVVTTVVAALREKIASMA